MNLSTGKVLVAQCEISNNICVCVCAIAAGDLTVSLPDGLTTLDGIHLQLTPGNLVCPNVQISGIDTSNINNITLQVTLTQTN